MKGNPEWYSSYEPVSPKDGDTEIYRTNVHIVRITKSPSRWRFFSSWGAFFILEVGYLALAFLSITKHIPLVTGVPHFTMLAGLEVKMAFIATSILWQYLATYPIHSLVIQVYSAEWHYLLQRSDQTTPYGTDRVSTLVSGFMAYMYHFFSPNASKTFRLAAVISIMLRLLLGVAPASIILTEGFTDVPIPLNISDLTIGSVEAASYYSNTIPFVTSRAAAIARLEQVDGSIFNYEPDNNYLIPTPHYDSTPDVQGDIIYRTDLAHYNFTCNWVLPDHVSGESVQIAAFNWTTYQFNGASSTNATGYTSGVFPLIPSSSDSSSFFPVNETDLSVYLFAGANSTFQLTTTNSPSIILDNIPSSGELSTAFPNINSSLVSFLVCDPRSNLTNAEIQLSGTNRQLGVGGIVMNDTTGIYRPLDNTRVGNMPQDASNVIFSTSMLDAVSDGVGGLPDPGLYLTRIAARLFTTQNVSGSSTENSGSFQPLSLIDINRHLNSYFGSASKAFTDGYRFDQSVINSQSSIFQSPQFASVRVSATQNLISVIGLSGSGIAIYMSTGWIVLLIILIPFLYKGWKRGSDYPFTLDGLARERLLKDL